MGIFSIFSKQARQNAKAAADIAAAQSTVSIQPASNRTPEQGIETPRPNAPPPNSTAMKIDAIESEMSSEFVYPTTILNTMLSDTAKNKKIVSAQNDQNAPGTTRKKDSLAADTKVGTIQVA